MDRPPRRRMAHRLELVTLTPRLATAADLPLILADLDRAPRIAIDTEFHAERRHRPKLYLVQFHVDGGGTWIVDGLDAPLLAHLARPLRAVTWVVHGGIQDLRILDHALGGLPETVLDTQIAAGLVESGYPAPYGLLIERHLGITLGKTATLSDWSRRPLSVEQLSYACDDVLLLLRLWDTLAASAQGLGHGGALISACEEAREEASADPSEASFRAIARLAAITPTQACVLQELVQWREEVARAEDQPARSVLGDGIALELSRRQPSTLDGLTSDRRMPRAIVKRHGVAIIDRIQRALARPEWAHPRFVGREGPAARKVAFLELLVASLGDADGFSPRLVGPRERLERLILADDTSREAVRAALGSWRDDLCGAQIARAMAGRISLCLGSEDVVNETSPPREGSRA